MFHPIIQHWFTKRFHSPTEAQAQGFKAIAQGGHTLIAAPTGSGKTLAAFLWAIDDLFKASLHEELPEQTRVLYLSPLKALATDIHLNLQTPLLEIEDEALKAGLKPYPMTTALRTGDTSTKERQALIRKPAHILATTPESLYLLLTSDSGRNVLSTVRTVIVDEIHALAGNRRGSHLALSLERLQALVTQPLQRIGLSATQKPIEEVAHFLTGNFPCSIINTGHFRTLDLDIELPNSPLSAVMSNEVWQEVCARLVELIQNHQTTLIFVNTKRLAERLTKLLEDILGSEQVTSHHGSLSAKLRHQAEQKLKAGTLKALVATSSLELGIDVGAVDLVCQVGSTRSIAVFLQRIGRSGHTRHGIPKGRIFPLSRDELVECAALVKAVQQENLDALHVEQAPLDILAQQMVAETACKTYSEDDLFKLVTQAYPYRNLTRQSFNDVLQMLQTGYTTRQGRRGVRLHSDGVHHQIRARRGAKMLALRSGGAIPDNADYDVIVEPQGLRVGSLNEDFAIESMAGDIFQLGNRSWRIIRIGQGKVFVEDAQGQPPSIPFWLGEAPGRTDELSAAVSELRAHPQNMQHFSAEVQTQLKEYFETIQKTLGVIPNQQHIVAERFFDESGCQQLVLHTPFGSRLNRAWGLALRKRFCRTFNFELQAAATEDAILLSLGEQHSFPLLDVFQFLKANSVREVLIQALLDAPMFQTRWRWNATRSLAILRFRGAGKSPAQLVRMQADDLLAAVFPDQAACAENLVGERQIPDHPLVKQTIDDCLHEAMDIDGLIKILEGIENKTITYSAVDTPEPSPLSHEILNAKPYAFLDDAPLEERRARAVYTRRALDVESAIELGALDSKAIEQVIRDAWPQAQNKDEVHDALMYLGVLREDEVADWNVWLKELQQENRAYFWQNFWIAAERFTAIQGAYAEDESALLELVRGRIECSGPITAQKLAILLHLDLSRIEHAFLMLEAEGFVLRGFFNSNEQAFCERRLLARIHRLTIARLRAEIEPVSSEQFSHYLKAWQHVEPAYQLQGPDSLALVLQAMEGFEIPAPSFIPFLKTRIKDFQISWLDAACLSGEWLWARLHMPKQKSTIFSASHLQTTSIAMIRREHLDVWLQPEVAIELSSNAKILKEVLQQKGAVFFFDLVKSSRLLRSQAEKALLELVACGLVTSDSFAGLRALVLPAKRKNRLTSKNYSVDVAGRWSLIDRSFTPAENQAEIQARTLLLRYGVIFRKLIEDEKIMPWRDLVRIYRRLEARGEIRGGHFVAQFTGEQFALPEAISLLREVRKKFI